MAKQKNIEMSLAEQKVRFMLFIPKLSIETKVKNIDKIGNCIENYRKFEKQQGYNEMLMHLAESELKMLCGLESFSRYD